MKLLLSAVACVMLLAGRGLAEEPGAPPPGSLKAAEKLAEVMNLKGQLGGGFEALMPMVNNVAEQMKLTPQERVELEATFRRWYVEDFDHAKILNDTVRLYATTFTEEELVVLTQFYSTPVGRKSLAMMPELMKQSVVMAMMEGKAKQEQLKARLEILFSEKVQLGHNDKG